VGAASFYWHDYETSGSDPARDRPVQFAGLRTDSDLNVVGEPLVLYARPAGDCLPQPQACLVTGISPQTAQARGEPECEFIGRIHRELAHPGTCGVGYNSLRFDDEVTRYTLYRNFHEPYAREWQHGNSRWDLIDLVRAACALRPEGIEWPLREDGHPSFRLEDLTAANGIGHEAAHDALSDVRATIGLARLVKARQPRLYHYALGQRDKRAVLAQLDVAAMKPLLHVSGMFGAARHNIALIAPLAPHPLNRNEVICIDLSADPAPLLELDADQLRELLFTRAEELPRGRERPGLKTVHVNRCPFLVTAKMADPATAERLGISGARCRAHLAALREYRERHASAFAGKLQALYGSRSFEETDDPDRMLYGGGFFSDSDRREMERVRKCAPRELGCAAFSFQDPRLPEMLFRYRARNYPDTLSAPERARWDEFRFRRLTEPDAGASICLEAYQEEIGALLSDPGLPPARRALLQQLLEYGDALLA
jgi:exodeoxyribonuclease-1